MRFIDAFGRRVTGSPLTWIDTRERGMTALQTTGMAPSADGRPEIFVPCVGGDGNTVQLWHLYE